MEIGGMDWMVIVAGLAAIAWVNWYFFVAAGTPSASRDAGAGGGRREPTGTDDRAGGPVESRGRAEE
ncbi:MAG TPA: hypothetical protein VFX39_09110 [Gemmatimonadaceae bacterium]|jgi:hypothetical protein|nr:hypothetical protein [Gemmatimonadaceae bacterium]